MDPLSGDVRQPQGFRLERYRIATQTNMESLTNTGRLCGFHFDLRHFQSKLACQSFRVQRLALSDFDVVRCWKILFEASRPREGTGPQIGVQFRDWSPSPQRQ